MRDKQGNYLTLKEYMERWKQGISNITPLQQAVSTQRGNYVLQFGLLCGIVASVVNYKNFWWVIIILAAAFFNNLIQLIVSHNRIKMLKELEDPIIEESVINTDTKEVPNGV